MARSRKIGGVYAELTLKDQKFRKGLQAAGASIKHFGGMAIKAGAVATGALAAGLAVGTKRTIAMGAELDHLSTQTGVAVSSLMKLQQAYKDNGKNADSAGKDIGKMQRAIYDAAQQPGSTIDYFAELGLSAEKLMAMSPERQFFAIGEALKATENQTKKAALALSIFGRSGGELLTVFEGSKLDDVNASLGRMPEIMDRFSGSMERVDTLIGRLPNKSEQFFTGFTSGIIGQVLPGLEDINNKDFTTLGESLGDHLSKAFQILTDGTAWEVFKLNGENALLELANSSAMNNFAAVINTIIDGITDGKNFNFDESLAKYQNAGKSENNSQIEANWRKIGELLAESNAKSDAKKNTAEAIGKELGPILERALPPWLSGDFGQGNPMYRDPALKDAIEKDKGSDWRSSSYSVNEMQARGLGMGGSVVMNKENEKVTLLTQIRDAIRAGDDGILAF